MWGAWRVGNERLLLATVVQIGTLGTATIRRSGYSEATVVGVFAAVRVVESRLMAGFGLRLKLFLGEFVRTKKVEAADEKEPNDD